MSPNKIWAGLGSVSELALAGNSQSQGIIKLASLQGNMSEEFAVDDLAYICGGTRVNQSYLSVMFNNNAQLYGVHIRNDSSSGGIDQFEETSIQFDNGSMLLAFVDGFASGIAYSDRYHGYIFYMSDITTVTVSTRDYARIAVYGFA